VSYRRKKPMASWRRPPGRRRNVWLRLGSGGCQRHTAIYAVEIWDRQRSRSGATVHSDYATTMIGHRMVAARSNCSRTPANSHSTRTVLTATWERVLFVHPQVHCHVFSSTGYIANKNVALNFVHLQDWAKDDKIIYQH